MRSISLIFCLLAMTCAAAMAQGDANKGKALYATCAACHGQNGEGNLALNSPALAGQEDWYLLTQLKNYKAGIRGTNPKDIYGMQMRPMSMTLADEQAMKDVIAYIKTFKPGPLEDTVKGGDAAKGKSLYMTCAACHGQQAEGMKALNAPKLTVQQDWYLLRQLKYFKEGIRGTDPKDIYGMQMRPMSMILADEQAMKDVVAYIRQVATKK
jgi:cytochrome c oxidase subunit 2